jgi:hypothetical protein
LLSFSFLRAQSEWLKTSSLGVRPPETRNSSTPKRYSQQSTKQLSGILLESKDTAKRAGQPWRVELHSQVAKIIAQHGGIDAGVFRPSIGSLIEDLRANPKQYPKKAGKLKTLRAANLAFGDGVTWRAVFALDEAKRSVRVLSLGPHDTAYSDAKRRI